jgi:hypothetical protein
MTTAGICSGSIYLPSTAANISSSARSCCPSGIYASSLALPVEGNEPETVTGRQGFFSPISRNPNKDGRFSRKPRGTSDLAFSYSFVGFRLFAPIVVLCQCNDTHNDTRRGRPTEPSRVGSTGAPTQNVRQKRVKLDRHRSTLQRSVGIRYRVQSTSICANRMCGCCK